jgi:hypothetical protein
MNDRAMHKSSLESVLTLIALAVVLTCLAGHLFWWTHSQFAECNARIWNRPQPGYCGVILELNWLIWYGPLVSLGISFGVLLLRRQRWHSSPFLPALVFWFSALLFIPTLFGMFLGAFLENMH